MTHATVTSAQALSSSQLELIKDALRKKYGKEVHVDSAVNPELLGGVQIRIGARLLDGSIAGKLAQMKQAVTA